MRTWPISRTTRDGWTCLGIPDRLGTGALWTSADIFPTLEEVGGDDWSAEVLAAILPGDRAWAWWTRSEVYRSTKLPTTSAPDKIDPGALAFCRRAFGIETVLSGMDFSTLSLPHARFDVIWCGSLLTHLDERSAGALLQTFHRCLDEGGVCIFTTHGQQSADWIRSGAVTYGLPAADQKAVLQQYDEGRYAYADLDGQPGIG